MEENGSVLVFLSACVEYSMSSTGNVSTLRPKENAQSF